MTDATTPFIITVESAAGTITWTPSEHDQQHLRKLSDAERESVIGVVQEQLAREVETLSAGFCLLENPVLAALMAVEQGLIGSSAIGEELVSSLIGDFNLADDEIDPFESFNLEDKR